MEEQGKKRQRTCVACGQQSDKIALHRVVRNGQGEVSFDPTGRVAGRGAYVCSQKCLAAACKTGKLGRALRCAPSNVDFEKISSDLATALRES